MNDFSSMEPQKRPTPDPAEHNAYFPSPFTLAQWTAPKSNLSGASYPIPYRGDKNRILVIATDERYLLTESGALFSTGNHPIETLLPLYHLDKAGFVADFATLSGNPVKFEMWAMPRKDEEIGALFNKYLPQIKKPAKLADIVSTLDADSPYAALFIPGGHGALIGLPNSEDVKKALQWAMTHDKHIISLCHGPAAFLSAATGENKDNFLFKGYRICAFPDAMDKLTPSLGYMPGHLPIYQCERLSALGVEILNQDVTGRCHQDRKLITGDSPLAANTLGQLAAGALLMELGLA